MANRQIPNLTPVVFLSPTAQIEIVQDGVTYRASAGQIGALGGGTGAIEIRNNITEPAQWYPMYANIIEGQLKVAYVSDPYYHYLPKEGRLSALRLEATQGIVFNNSFVTMDYTFPLNDNATSCGPLSISSVITVPAGSVWAVL